MSLNYTHEHKVCYAEVVDPLDLWGWRVYPLENPVPILLLQMTLAVGINHGFLLLCQRFGQPRFVSYLMTALVFSPSFMHKLPYNLNKKVWPTKSNTIFKAVANLGLLYATFIEAVQPYPTPISHCRTKIIYLSFFVFIFSFAIGGALYFELFYLAYKSPISPSIGWINIIHFGLTITSTGFSTLAPILSKLKLLCTRLGQEALLVSLLNEFCTWTLINITLAIVMTPEDDYNKSIDIAGTSYVLLFMVLYVVFCCTVIKPAISKIVTIVPECDSCGNGVVDMILCLVLACGLLTHYIGSHFVFGAYVLGRIIPPGVVAKTLVEKMEDCVDGVLMPLYCVVLGIHLDVFPYLRNSHSYAITLIIVFAVATKVICTTLIGFFCKIPFVDSLSFGILLSSKGFLPLVLLYIGQERKILTFESYSVQFLIILLSTFMVGPIMSIICKRIRKTTQPYDQRRLQGANVSENLSLITCIHTSENIHSIMKLLEISNITTEHPASVHVTHLIELVGHAPAMLVEHESQGSFFDKLSSKLLSDQEKSQSDQIVKKLNEYKDQHDNATSSFKVFTIVSPIDTMHEDICNLAKDKQASLIILLFHKQQGLDGNLEDMEMDFKSVNQNVLDKAPCSVALLVDRGLRMFSMSSSSDSVSDDEESCEQIQIAMIYIGGPDDREALTYAWRMAGHSNVDLTVIRFLEGEEVMDDDQPVDHVNLSGGNVEVENYTTSSQKAKELQVDNEFLLDFQEKTCFERSICYFEKVINCGREIIASLREMDYDFNLFIVGKGQSRKSLVTVGLVKWSEFKELGPIGDILVTSEFTSNASVLVMQQYVD